MDFGVNFQNLIQGQLEPVFYGILAVIGIVLLIKRSFPILIGTTIIAGLCGAYIVAPEIVAEITLSAFKKVFG